MVECLVQTIRTALSCVVDVVQGLVYADSQHQAVPNKNDLPIYGLQNNMTRVKTLPKHSYKERHNIRMSLNVYGKINFQIL